MTLDTQTSAILAGVIIAFADFLVGALKATGSAKNIIHFAGIGIAGAFTAIVSAVKGGDEPKDGAN